MQENTKGRVVAGVLMLCLATVGFWEVMANRSRRPWDGFDLTADDFAEFLPAPAGWEAEKLPVNASPIEPNVFAAEARRAPKSVPESGILESGGPPPHAETMAPVLVRLAHGYNMPDCMRIKGYSVEEMGSNQLSVISYQLKGVQTWRLTSDIGDVSVWATSMLRVGDCGVTDIDVRTMAFPRIGTPDDPRWLPQGMTLKSLRHPIRNFRWLIRSKWNNARCDLATFLKLKQPAWADDTLITFVSVWKGRPLKPDRETAALEHVLAAHNAMLPELQSWRRLREGQND